MQVVVHSQCTPGLKSARMQRRDKFINELPYATSVSNILKKKKDEARLRSQTFFCIIASRATAARTGPLHSLFVWGILLLFAALAAAQNCAVDSCVALGSSSGFCSYATGVTGGANGFPTRDRCTSSLPGSFSDESLFAFPVGYKYKQFQVPYGNWIQFGTVQVQTAATTMRV